MRVLTLAAILVVAAACSSDPAPSITKGSSPNQGPASTDFRRRQVELVLPDAAEMPSSWALTAELEFGDAAAQPGSGDTLPSPTGSGPECAVTGSDATVWVLDIHKHRVARYGSDGGFLGDVPIPGQFADVQLPFLLDDRWFWASGTPASALLATEGDSRRLDVPSTEQGVLWSYSDGETLYGATGQGFRTLSIDDGEVVYGTADALRTPAGQRFTASESGGVLTVRLLDEGLELRFTFTSRRGNRIGSGFEVAADAAGRLHFFLFADDAGIQLAGYFSIAPDGTVDPMETVRNPFNDREPPGPCRLRNVPGTEQVTLTYIDLDAVRIYGHHHAQQVRR